MVSYVQVPCSAKRRSSFHLTPHRVRCPPPPMFLRRTQRARGTRIRRTEWAAAPPRSPSEGVNRARAGVRRLRRNEAVAFAAAPGHPRGRGGRRAAEARTARRRVRGRRRAARRGGADGRVPGRGAPAHGQVAAGARGDECGSLRQGTWLGLPWAMQHAWTLELQHVLRYLIFL